MKLYVGCGNVRMKDWVNIDIAPELSPNLVHDASKPFPYMDNSIDFIYSEHFIEHLTVKDGVAFFKEAHRMLKPGGVMRVATFDMDIFLHHHREGNPNWKEDAGLVDVGLGFLKTRIESLNVNMRWWGHQYVYNIEELTRRLNEAGFGNVIKCGYHQSSYPELSNLETRVQSNLIFEAIK